MMISIPLAVVGSYDGHLGIQRWACARGLLDIAYPPFTSMYMYIYIYELE